MDSSGCTINASIIGLVGIYSVANVSNLVVGAAMLSLGIFAYVR
jgi:hypothetical protein